MDISFWHEKWARNDIGFHIADANPLLVKFFDTLSLATGSRVFVPLCGKTRDIAWLLSHGYGVVGVELSKVAIDQLFSDLGLEPDIAGEGELLRYRAENIDIFVGDLFHLSSDMLGLVDAIYDRAAYVALPKDMRHAYAAHLTAISHQAPQLLICYAYQEHLMEGPPFSIDQAEVHQNYGNSYGVTLVDSVAVAGGFKGRFPATENVWLLK